MRNVGLDIARSLAIIMVLLSHGRMFFTKYGDVQSFSFNGLLGVELFFVLSGFLIGGIIIRDLVEENGSLMRFYSRRWLRTLPAYLLVLTVVVVFAIANKQSWYVQHYFFVQNFNYDQLGFFGVSWSLSIEEWFYLLAAPSFIVLMRFGRGEKKLLFFGFCAFVIAASIVAKVVYTYQSNPPWDAGIRKQIFLRMDSIMFGVVLAGIKHYFKPFYERVSSSLLFFLSVTFTILIALYYVIELEAGRDRINHSIIGRTILFDAISFTFMILVWSLEKSKKINLIQGKVRTIATFIATTSYSIYLIHYEIFIHVNEWSQKINSVPFTLIILLTTTFIVFVLAYLLHKYWELPFMNLRERSSHKKESLQI